ncbi:hypothetical protein [Escherichia coli ISC41]|nr:hypothetical protein [Escherichia coli ISC41]
MWFCRPDKAFYAASGDRSQMPDATLARFYPAYNEHNILIYIVLYAG